MPWLKILAVTFSRVVVSHFTCLQVSTQKVAEANPQLLPQLATGGKGIC